MRAMILMIFFIFSATALAADIPQVDEGAAEYNQERMS